jgi:hypothetical protein
MPEDLPRAAQPEYLTDALRSAGALGAGRVCDVVMESSKATILSRIIRLRLSYDGPAADAPAWLILKTGLPERADARRNPGQYEVAFYTRSPRQYRRRRCRAASTRSGTKTQMIGTCCSKT